ncbi:MAG: citramalate synthase [Euryarchaeota archaeon]|nr:citramalate synthase [Euryarchaeota archaeon]
MYDTTLRDGAQTHDVTFSLEDKIAISERLLEYGFDSVEGGWPSSNPRDTEFFSEAKERGFNEKVAAFGMTSPAPGKDKKIDELIDTDAGVLTIFGKSWDLHVRDILHFSPERNLEMIAETVDYLKSYGFTVVYDAEHFFDGYKSDPSYAFKTLRSASNADTIVLCDTNGGTMPWEIERMVQEVYRRIKNPLGIHAHNDSGMALINSITAIKNGVTHVQGTMNGLGERCGNLDWCEFLPILSVKLGVAIQMDISELSRLSTYVERMTGTMLPKNKPFVGEDAFSHKGGVHIDAAIKNADAYEHITPDAVGNKRMFVLSEQVGRAGIVKVARGHGYDLDKDHPLVLEIVKKIKQKQSFTDAELFLLLAKELAEKGEPFELLEYETKVNSIGNAKTETKVRIGEDILHEIAEGVGPVHSLDMALRKALEKFYAIDRVHLSNLNVRIINQNKATAAKVEVFIEFRANGEAWSTSNVSNDIIKASKNALINGYKYHLLKTNAAPKIALFERRGMV